MRRLLLIVVPVALFAQSMPPGPAPAPATGGVEGRVTNAQTGEGIAGTALRLSPSLTPGPAPVAVYVTTSQADGSFRFGPVAAGNYLLFATHQGFSGSDATQPRQAIAVADGQQVTGVAVQLIPQGTISGRVLDEAGNPVPGRVQAFVAYVWRGTIRLRQASSADANETGGYVVKNVTPGKYFLVAEPDDEPANPSAEQSEFPFVRTFYPKALDFETATSLEIAAGQSVSGIEIRVQRAATYHVRGKVQAGITGQPWTLSLEPAGIRQSALAQTQAPKTDGSFDIPHVLPGSYVLRLTGLGTTGPAGERTLAREEIQVGAQDVDGIILSMIPPTTITGRVTLEGVDNANLSQVRLNAVSTEETQPPWTGSAAADGTFSIENLNPGQYAIHVVSGPPGTYVKAISFNRQDITNGIMDLSQGGSGEIEITLRKGAAEVDGTVQAGSSGDAQTAMLTVLLIPENVAADGSGTLMGSARRGGNFVIRNVRPGRYYAFAIGQWNSIWQNGDFLREMQSLGANVDVQENATVQIQVQTVTADDIQRAAARLGLTVQ